ncbi:MAG: ion transporter [Epsilonproteobacteria bacterium]|nr:ion transporter [Campylobacterota bacterium]
MFNYKLLQETFSEVISNKYFEMFMMGIIVFSAMLIGIDTFNLDPVYEDIIFTLDRLITIVFVIEISIRITAYEKPWHFFKSGWNIFDFVIVTISLVPIDGNNSDVARLLRIFRVLRLITIMPELKGIINALFKSAKSIGYVLILMFIIFYIFAVSGTVFFAETKSGLWSDVGTALLTLFRVMTFEGWTEVMYETMEIHPWSWAFYLSFIFLTTFTFLNMIIGIILDTLNEEHKKENQEAENEEKQLLRDLIEQNRQLNEKIDKLEHTIAKHHKI